LTGAVSNFGRRQAGVRWHEVGAQTRRSLVVGGIQLTAGPTAAAAAGSTLQIQHVIIELLISNGVGGVGG